MTAAVPGTLVGSGRNADVYDIGDGRVLRRYRDGRDPAQVAAEAAVMGHARASGVPVPEVFDVSGADIVMSRAAGPTMLDVLGRRPWRAASYARLLARLHGLVHQVPAAGLPGPVRPFPWEMPAVSDPDVLLHRDLHPANVILTAAGPVIIDWEGATCGPAIADVAMTWVIIGFSDVPPTPLVGAVVGGVQQYFTRAFVRAAGPLDDEWRLAAIRQRLADPNLLPAEVARLGKLVPAAPAPGSVH
ncbi:MAG TPA: aminoglycoside phosphotransferase family protein [Trebonia sp.]|jgi:aminoglycoside phosphotransferase (APT) family kinase protein|nr:aminoglycoside phosphotransferase family protein [Trebonia sp.]